MKLGFFTMPLHPPGADFTKTLDHDMEQVVTLDKLGYTEAWIGEHFTFEWENIPSPELFIANALGLTKNIVFGTGVTCMPIHNPGCCCPSHRPTRSPSARTLLLGSWFQCHTGGLRDVWIRRRR